MVYDYHPCDASNNHHRRHYSKKVLLPLLLFTSATSATSSASEAAATAASLLSAPNNVRNRSSHSQRVRRGESPSSVVDIGTEWMEGDGVADVALVSEEQEDEQMEGAYEWGEMDVGEFSNSTSPSADDDGELDLGDVSISNSNSNLGGNEDVDAAAEEDEDEDEDGSIEVGEFSSVNSDAMEGDEANEEDEDSLEIGQVSSANSNSNSNNDPRQSEEETDEEDVMTQWPDPITLPSTEEEGAEENPTDVDDREDQEEDEEELDQLPTDFLPPDFFPSAEIDESNEESSGSTSNLCSCSPRSYGFRLTLDQSCLVNDLNDNGGIGVTLCILSNGNDSGDGNTADADTVPVVVTSLQFLEFDTSGNVVVINQDDTYNNVTFQNGDIVRYDSVSMDLDENLDLENQLGFVPGGVQLTIRGRPLDSGSNGDADAIVINRLTWSYTNECEFVPVENGDRIGWVTMEEIEPASTAFCPALVTTTTTSATTTTTTAATTTTTPTETSTTTMMATTTMAETTATTTATTEPTSVATTTTTKPHKIDSKSSKMAKSSTLDAKTGKEYSSAKSDKYFVFTKTGKQMAPSSKSGKAENYHDHEDMSMMSIASGSAKSGKSDRLFRTRSRQDGMIRRR